MEGPEHLPRRPAGTGEATGTIRTETLSHGRYQDLREADGDRWRAHLDEHQVKVMVLIFPGTNGLVAICLLLLIDRAGSGCSRLVPA
jgi:hypothetical protein